jgi:hypothetical protein
MEVGMFRKQQSLNLLALKHVNDINISASPHRTLNSSRGIIRNRDDDLSELTDAEICKELEPQGIITVKPVFRGCHMRFPTIGTLVSIFTSVAIMALL